MSYKTLKQQEIEKSDKFILTQYQNIPQEKLDTMDDFLFWLEYDYEEEISKENMEDIKSLVNKFLGIDIDKVKQAELNMLEKWSE